MIRSMTGFARVSGAISDRYHVSVTIKSVNHRYLEASVRLPEFLWETESVIRAMAAEILGRGKIDISVRVQRTGDPDYSVRINARIANAVVPQLRSLMEEQGLGNALSGSDLLRIPDLINVEAVEGELDPAEQEQFTELIRAALSRVTEMRDREGEGLRKDILARMDSIAALRDQLLAERESINAELAEQFRARVAEIVKAVDSQVNEDRIAQELVMMAERADVAEELSRLGIHVDQVRKLIAGKEPAGKKLDFLSQEMLREINTLGSKSRSSTIRTIVVELKAEVERIREQVQNVE